MNTQIFIGPHGHDYQDVWTTLAAFKGETIVFVPNSGNAGDNLINLGTYRLLEALGLRYVIGNSDELYPDRVIVHGGGGSLVPYYRGADTFFRRNHCVCKAMILLPHTIRAHADIISDMDERCHLFAREKPSYDFASQYVKRAHLYRAHDMAFMLDTAYIEGLRWNVGDLYRMGLLKSWATMIVKFTAMAKLGNSTLHSLRTDAETNSIPTHPLNYDMSMIFATGDMRLPPCSNVAKALSTVLQAYRHIKTDRLHIAILSAILGLDVEMHDNNYGKNRDIYRNSMADRFNNVRFLSA